MAGAACKTIIDMIMRALINAIEVILLNPNINQGKIPEPKRLELIQRLADVDLSMYEGNTDLLPEGGLTGILFEFQRYGLVTEEIWEILRKPFIVGDKTRKSKKNENNDKKE